MMATTIKKSLWWWCGGSRLQGGSSSSELTSQATNRRQRELTLLKPQRLSPATYFCQGHISSPFPNSSANCGSSIQVYVSMEAILIQTPHIVLAAVSLGYYIWTIHSEKVAPMQVSLSEWWEKFEECMKLAWIEFACWLNAHCGNCVLIVLTLESLAILCWTNTQDTGLGKCEDDIVFWCLFSFSYLLYSVFSQGQFEGH